MIPKTITPTELRQNLYGIVHEVASKGNRYLITPNEGDAVVLCSRDDFNALVAERQLLRDIRDGEADIAAGRTSTSAEVRAWLSHRGKAGRPATKQPAAKRPAKKRRSR
jgi:PHD/YefM family antitoxin component YafN of YafNO toxin-antitoxin module